MNKDQLVKYLDELLNVAQIKDSSLNGLQVDSSKTDIQKIAVAVDTSLAGIEKASAANTDMLIVHHGLFWGQPAPISGNLYYRIKKLLDSDMALYASHLPLDLHAELGNNAQIQNILNWPIVEDFGDYHGILIGKEVKLDSAKSMDEIVREFELRLQCKATVWPFGKSSVQKIGYVSGGAVSLLPEAIDKDLDLFITGEPKHDLYWTAKEAGINVIFGGHYATETLGVKALAQKLENEFEVEAFFIDLPTGL